jgi:hypothetical protein
MNRNWKQRKLLEARERFESFHRLMDLVSILLFTVIAIATCNRLLPKKVVEFELFNLSWQTIGICFFFFLGLLLSQGGSKPRRILSPFEREAMMKAFHNNFRRRR